MLTVATDVCATVFAETDIINASSIASIACNMTSDRLGRGQHINYVALLLASITTLFVSLLASAGVVTQLCDADFF